MEPLIAHIDYKALYEQSQPDIMQLRQELDQLKKMIFGARQERFVANGADPAQLAMGLESEVVAATSLVKAKRIEYTRSQGILTNPATSHPGRMKLPEHLERKEILVDVDHPEGSRQIGQEITEELEYQPGKLYVNRFVRPKYISPDNQSILIAPMPERPLPKAMNPRKGVLCFIRYWELVSCMINPFEWLKRVLEIIPTHPINKIKEFLQHNFKT